MLVGWVMSRKSVSGNTILNKDDFAVTSKSTAKCQVGTGKVSGRPVTDCYPELVEVFSTSIHPRMDQV